MIRDRETLKEYILRSLGHPVIRINVADEQIDDRIDDALLMFNEYHFDGSEIVFLKHEITEEDIENEYILLPNQILSVLRVMSMERVIFGSSFEYHAFMNEIMDTRRLAKEGLHSYAISKSYMNTINNIMRYERRFRFNRYTLKLILTEGWDKLVPGEFLVFEAHSAMDYDHYTRIWNDLWLKQYATTLVKLQWGQNLSKYSNASLPGGVTINDRMLEEAKREKEELEERLRLEFSKPVDFFVG